MFLSGFTASLAQMGFPRIRGDVPLEQSLREDPRVVFPAYAGMFLGRRIVGDRACGFPRIRGDVPYYTSTIEEPARFSPHTRGCSGGS